MRNFLYLIPKILYNLVIEQIEYSLKEKNMAENKEANAYQIVFLDLENPDDKASTLRQIAKPVEIDEIKTPAFQNLINEMLRNLYETKGVGIAAPQVGVSKRVFIIDTDYLKPEGKKNPIIFINPKIKTSGENKKSEEGCLSIRHIRAEVDRKTCVEIEALDREGQPFTLKVDSESNWLLCRCSQHENGHLDGTLFIDRLDPSEKEKLLEAAIKILREEKDSLSISCSS
jgi:peptide deformylase